MRISDWSSDVCSSDLTVPESVLQSLQQIIKADCRRLEICHGSEVRASAPRVFVIDGLGLKISEEPAQPFGRGDSGIIVKDDVNVRVRSIPADRLREIGRASGRERVCHYV